MAPPLSAPGDTTSAQTIYSFPFPSPSAASSSSSSTSNRSSNELATKSTTIIGAGSSSTTEKPRPKYVCSDIPQTTGLFFLHRRLLLPTFIIPVTLLCVPPLVVSTLAFLAYHVTGAGGSSTSLAAIFVTSFIIIASTLLLVRTGKIVISSHVTDDKTKDKILTHTFALHFWSLIVSIISLRILHSFWGVFRPLFTETLTSSLVESSSHGGGGWFSLILGLMRTTSFWAVKTCYFTFFPSVAWAWISIIVAIRYTGPFSPILRCSSTPLKTNPFDAALAKIGRNFTSKNRFLDMIANGLDKLSAATSPDTTKKVTTAGSSATTAQTTQKSKGEKQKKELKSKDGNRTPGNSLVSGEKNGMLELLKLSSAANARYSRPGLSTIVIQVIANIICGHIFARTFVLPFLGRVLNRLDGTIMVVTVASCLLVPVLELFSIINETELHYSHYSSVGNVINGEDGLRFLIAFGNDVLQRVHRSLFGYAMTTPIIATLTISLWAHFGQYLLTQGGTFFLDSPSYPAIMQSLLISYIVVAFTVIALAIQDVLTRWAVCAPGVDADVLLYHSSTISSKQLEKKTNTTTKSGGVTSSPTSKKKFLTEDLLIQSILMGDGNTVSLVIASPDTEKTQPSMTLFKSHQDDEISRNDRAIASFAKWIQVSSTTASGRLSDDILRMALLESFGGGGCSISATSRKQSPSRYFGDKRHSSALRKRLDLSAATALPGRQPIAAPVIRALCAFAGGVGDAMHEIYSEETKGGKPVRKSSAETWKLPPGSLAAAELSIVAAARFVVMNSAIDKRHERICLLLPCILQSAFKLRRGIFAYAKFTATLYEVKLSSFDKTGRTDGLLQFIEERCPTLCPVISACNHSARMVIQTDNTLEEVVLRRKWTGDMQKWLVELSCQES